MTNKPIATLGNFDGVHLGHQHMIKRVVELAKQQGSPSIVIVFEPQPLEYFSEDPPARLTTFHEKSVMFRSLGVDQVYCLDFNVEMASLSAESFVQDILAKRFSIGHLVVGDDFRFGHQKQGDLALLQALGAVHGFTSEGVGSIMVGSERVSSTGIREALKSGNLALAAQWLGRSYSMRGIVQKGDQRGRLLGYPTANLEPARVKVPLTGVFAVTVPGLGRGMANLGTRPTVDGFKTLLEVNIFDFNQSIYGQEIEVVFCHKIRDEQRFESLEALKAQIQADHTAVESYFHHG